MTMKSWSSKLFLGIAAAAVVMWVAGVPGRTILSVAAVGLMLTMHAGDHGGHGGHDDHSEVPGRPARTEQWSSVSPPGAADSDPATGTRRGPGSGCH